MSKVQYINRKTKKICEEKIPGEKYLRYLYYSTTGKFLLKALIIKKMISDIYGILMKMSFTKSKVKQFVDEFNIDMDLFEKPDNGFDSFNEFFIRKINPVKYHIDNNEDILISPADGKILAFDKVQERTFNIKGIDLDLEKLLQDKQISKRYRQGSMVIIRLAPADYHRFHFPCDCIPSATNLIKGKYYSVSPIALREITDVFLQNKRTVCYLDKTPFGKIAYLEIGATMVGSIKQTYYNSKKKYIPMLVFKGQEKGYFEFGGSSIVLLFEEDKIILDKDLLENTNRGFETSIRFGESIGRVKDENNS
ncbi:MAG: phosphatidylserine decarboxylase [Candidatus Cloacimonetes bacterium]|nr:phosphatidylserine decarboxylase [Candidatus Cloacimonadota bacterium]